MGYTIQYGQTAAKKVFHKENRVKRKKIIVLACITLVVISVLFLFRESLYPGDRAVTKEALGNMAQNIQSGESIPEAFRTFCQEIITGADFS